MLNHEQVEIIQEKTLRYNKSVRGMGKTIHIPLFETERSYQDSLKTTALICSATAALALPIFSSEMPRSDILLVAGVITLLVDVIVVFHHLSRRTTRAFQELVKAKEMIRPIQQLVQNGKEALLGKMSFEDYDKKEKETILQLGTISSLPEPEKITYIDEFILWILTVGISLIISSFLWPYLTALLSKI